VTAYNPDGTPIPTGTIQIISSNGQVTYGNTLSTLAVSSITVENHSVSSISTDTISVTSTINTGYGGITFNTGAGGTAATLSTAFNGQNTALYFNGHQLNTGGPSGVYWTENNNTLVNTNTNDAVSTTKNLIVASTLSVTTGGATINGLLTANNGININGGSNIAGGSFITGTLTSANNFSTLGNADITGYLSTHNTLNVASGGATINGLLIANNGANIFGGTTNIINNITSGSTGGLRVVPQQSGAAGITLSNYNGTSQWSLINSANNIDGNLQLYRYNEGVAQGTSFLDINMDRSINTNTDYLNIIGSTFGTAQAQFSATTGGYMNLRSNGYFSLYSNNTELHGQAVTNFSSDNGNNYINNGGNVGIGTNTPNTKLQVIGNISTVGNTTITGNLTVGNTNNITDLYLNSNISITNNSLSTTSNSINFYKSKNLLSTSNNNELGYIYFNGTTSTNTSSKAALIYALQDGNAGNDFVPGRIQFHTNDTNNSFPPLRMLINSQGNVGIGTATPTHTLEVNGSFQITNNGEVDIFKNTGNGNYLYIGAELQSTIRLGAWNGVYNSARNLSMFVSNSGNQVAGNLGIGTANPQALLHVNGSTRIDGPIIITPIIPSTIGQVKVQLNSTNTTNDTGSSNLNIFRIPGTATTCINNGGGGDLALGTATNYSTILVKNSGGNYVTINGAIQASGNLLYSQIITVTGTSILSNLINNPSITGNVRVVILAIGGGGGGGGAFGSYGGGGGGSGQEINATYYLPITTSLNITIGNGGIGGTGAFSPVFSNRGSNGDNTSVISSDNKVQIYALGGNGADNNGLAAVNPDYGGNGYYGGGCGGSELTSDIGTVGSSYIYYPVRTGKPRYVPSGATYSINGGAGDGPQGNSNNSGDVSNIGNAAAGAGGGSSSLGTGGAGGTTKNSGTGIGGNGTYGSGGGGGMSNNTGSGTYYNGGNGGPGCVQLQIFAI
jgi:hypothetical protein